MGIKLMEITRSVSDKSGWLEAIEQNDVTSAKSFLVNVDEENRLHLLNGKIYRRNEPIAPRNFTNLDLRRPLNLAIAFSACDVIRIMLEFGVDVTVTEENGDTAVHVLNSLCDLAPEYESKFVSFYQWFIELLDLKDVQKILHTENLEGLRPLEAASHKGHFKLMRAIFETKGVYLVKEENLGIFTKQYFDITEYEGRKVERFGKSPLGFITFMSELSLSRQGTRDIFTWMPLKQWHRLKLKSNAPFVIMWLLLRLLQMVLYFLTAVNKQRDDSQTPLNETLQGCSDFEHYEISSAITNVCIYYIMTTSLLILVLDFCELFYTRVRRTPCFIYKTIYYSDVVVSMKFYRASQHIVAWAFSIFCAMLLTDVDHSTSKIDLAREVLHIVAVMGNFASILYLLQMISKFGHYVVTIQRMLKDLFHFMILFIVCLVPFTYYFMVFFNDNTLQGCIAEFHSFESSFYTSFIMTLNMVNLRNFNVNMPVLVQIVHFAFVFIVGILLINFLIAVMSNSVAEMSGKRTLVQTLERLHVVLIIEARLRWLLGRYYDNRRRRLGYGSDDRVILTNIVWRSKFKDVSVPGGTVLSDNTGSASI